MRCQHHPPGEEKQRHRGKGGRKTPAGTRSVGLPPSIAVFYELLVDSHNHAFVFTTPEGRPWRRSNFRQRFWRPAWDGVKPDEPLAKRHQPAILPWFTFHEGRHSDAAWLAEDGCRRSRVGHGWDRR